MTRPPRPDPLEFEADAVPDTLTNLSQWVAWRYKFDTDRDEWTKVPVDTKTGDYAKSTDPDTHVSFEEAVAYHNTDTDTDGLGFVVRKDGVVAGLDLDDVRDPDTGDLEPWAEGVLDDVSTYSEVSPSGTGLRLFGLGFIPPDGGNRGDIEDGGHLELYDEGRYLTVTGHTIDDSPEDVRRVNDAIADLHEEYIASDGVVEADSPDANPGVDADKPGSTGLSDDELLEKATNAENGDKFRRLWIGDTSGYPSHSEADLALAGLLAFWTGGDRQRMDDLFRNSGLMRDKWDREDYRERTIDKALTGRSEFYDPDARESRPNEPGDHPEAGGMNVALTPGEVEAWAGLSDDESVSDLTDRQKAACVWGLIRESDEYHVRVRRDNASLWAYDDGVWTHEGERALRTAARRALGSMDYGQNVLTELKSQARADREVEVEADEFGLDTGHVAVNNGLVDLEAAANGAGDDALRALRPEDYALACLPVDYDPGATYDEWADVVDEWAEDGRADALQEYVGYCLHIGEIPIDRALMLVGSGANGKGTFLSVVRALLGRENTSSIELQTLANERDAVAEFYGSLANIDDDLSPRQLGQGVGMFKKLVAGDRVRGRHLYEEGFSYDATGKHMYAANEVPQVDVPDEDEAFWRRWLLVEFPNHYPQGERDPSLRNELTQPQVLSGVLNWAIDGWHRLMDQGYFTNEHRYAHGKRERWQAWGESIDKFISECVTRDEEADRISTSDAHRRYAAWCRENDVDPASQRKFTTRLKNENVDYGRHRIDEKVKRGYKALGLSDDVPELEDTPERATSDGRNRQEQLF